MAHFEKLQFVTKVTFTTQKCLRRPLKFRSLFYTVLCNKKNKNNFPLCLQLFFSKNNFQVLNEYVSNNFFAFYQMLVENTTNYIKEKLYFFIGILSLVIARMRMRKGMICKKILCSICDLSWNWCTVEEAKKISLIYTFKKILKFNIQINIGENVLGN